MAYNKRRGELVDLVKDCLNSGSIVGLPVSLRAMILHTNKLADGVILILRMSSPKYSSRAVQEASRFRRGRYGRLHELSRWVSPTIDVALTPRLDSSCPSS